MATPANEFPMAFFEKCALDPTSRSLYFEVKESKDTRDIVEIQAQIKDEIDKIVLNVKGIQFYDVETSFFKLVKILKKSPIKKLDLHIPLSVDCTYVITDYLKQDKTLRTLNIRSVDGSPKHSFIETLAKWLESNKTLQFLFLNSMDLKEESVFAIVAMFKVNRGLDGLGLSGSPIGKPGLSAIFRALKTNKYLRSLNLSNSFGRMTQSDIAECMSECSEMLGVNRGLDSLDLSSNKIGREAILVISKGLIENPILNAINLRACDLEEGSGTAVARLVNACYGLRFLDLGFNRNLTEEDVLSIIEAIGMKPYMRQFNLFDVPMSEKCILALAKILGENRSIDSIDLSREGITSAGALAIAEMLKKNTTLRSLYLGPLGGSNARVIVNALEENQSLNVLRLNLFDVVELEDTLINSIVSNPCLEVVLEPRLKEHRMDSVLDYYRPLRQLKKELDSLIYWKNLYNYEIGQLEKTKDGESKKWRESVETAEADDEAEVDRMSRDIHFWRKWVEKLLARIAILEKSDFCSPTILHNIKKIVLALKGTVFGSVEVCTSSTQEVQSLDTLSTSLPQSKQVGTAKPALTPAFSAGLSSQIGTSTAVPSLLSVDVSTSASLSQAEPAPLTLTAGVTASVPSAARQITQRDIDDLFDLPVDDPELVEAARDTRTPSIT